MFNVRPIPGPLAALLLTVPALAQDTRRVVVSEACKVEVLKGDGSPQGSLRIAGLDRRYQASLKAVGDKADLEAKPYDFTFSREGDWPGQGFDFVLKFTTALGGTYQCHLISKLTGDRIAVSESRWTPRLGDLEVQTKPGRTLLSITFK